jgi:seryl-tRNA synthetase
MHDIRWIRDNPEAFDRALARRGLAGEAGRLMAIDERRRAAIAKAEAAQARRNAASKEIGEAKKARDEGRASALMAEVADLKAAVPALEAQEKAATQELETALAAIPNLPLDEVPDGAGEDDSVEHHRFGERRNYPFSPLKQHFELGEALGQMDFETAAKLSGSRFVVMKRNLARLERALGQFMLDLHTSEHGYTEIAPPLMVRDDVMFGTAQLPKFAFDQFAVTRLMTDAEWDASIAAAEQAAPRSPPRDLAKAVFERQDSYFSSPLPRCRSPTSCARRSSRRPTCRSGWRR